MGQTPPPWHGQAVATQILFEHDWPSFHVFKLRMEFSEEMDEVGRFRLRKLKHLWRITRSARKILKENPGTVLFYPPSSARWIPYLRDLIFLSLTRHLAGSTVFIFHASGLADFVNKTPLLRPLSRLAYERAEVALEVALENHSPHEAFKSLNWSWCPCGIDVPEMVGSPNDSSGPDILLFVGSLQEGKGVLEILRTAAVLKREGLAQNYQFRIVGKWFSQEFEKQARALHDELELGALVEFVGELTGESKWAAYNDADIFFFPTHYASEATPIVIMEALGMGLPILSTQWAGIPAMLENCEASLLVPVRSPELFASAILQLTEQNRSRSMHQSAKSFYRDHFQPSKFIDRVENALILANESAAKLDSNHRATKYSSTRATTQKKSISVYLADQNPGYDRSYGISSMSKVVMEALIQNGTFAVKAIVSRSSQQAPLSTQDITTLPWGTRKPWVRLLTDHLQPLYLQTKDEPDIYYFPKGYLPYLSVFCQPSVVTIHDTIIQYDQDHYPAWRSKWEYAYWALMLKHTLRNADRILTVSESSRTQILAFMDRHKISSKEITVTYEPCTYEVIPQPVNPTKDDFVIHLASVEPHKRTAHLIQWWLDAENSGREIPQLRLIGTVEKKWLSLISHSSKITRFPFLPGEELQEMNGRAMALILSSEIEGFGLPALEAYYLGTPVCFVKGTSVEEILEVATQKGGFDLENPESLFTALEDVLAMSPTEIREIGLKLRETYAATSVVEKMVEVFRSVTDSSRV